MRQQFSYIIFLACTGLCFAQDNRPAGPAAEDTSLVRTWMGELVSLLSTPEMDLRPAHKALVLSEKLSGSGPRKITKITPRY